MGRRSRKRTGVVAAPDPSPADVQPRAAPAAVRRRARSDERPPAPWGAIPLTEIVTLAGIVALVGGYALRSTRVLAAGFAAVAIAALELAVREHFAGFRSHTSLLAGASGVAVAAPLAVLGVQRPLTLAIAVAVIAAAFVAFRRKFRRSTGGLGFRA